MGGWGGLGLPFQVSAIFFFEPVSDSFALVILEASSLTCFNLSSPVFAAADRGSTIPAANFLAILPW